MKEDDIVGHIHAYQSVVSVQARREALQKAAYKIIKDEIDHQSGVPPAEDVEHLEDVINATLRRKRKTVSSYAPEMGADSGDEDLGINKAVERAIPLLKILPMAKSVGPELSTCAMVVAKAQMVAQVRKCVSRIPSQQSPALAYLVAS
jgi:hypothetical protein